MASWSLWRLAGALLVASALLVLGGSAAGGDLGRMIGGYGLLLLLGALYMVVALAVRDRVWRHLSPPARAGSKRLGGDLHGRRIF
jgi:hypothetical protein